MKSRLDRLVVRNHLVGFSTKSLYAIVFGFVGLAFCSLSEMLDVPLNFGSQAACAQDRAVGATYDRLGYTQIERVQDVIENWSPERHLYVKGDLGPSDRQLRELEEWLKENAPHWTIVLLEDAAGEFYVAADGRSLFGIDAVEVALGMGLNNQTAFGQLEHPITHETDGAIFVLMLKERKFSYYGSEAQDRRGLGEANWFGTLDQPALRAMRSGGRVMDAVKDTVKIVNQRLERMVQSETEAAKTLELEQQRDLQSGTESIAHLREVLEDVERESKEFQINNNSATGELTRPPLEEWRSRLETLAAETKLGNAKNTLQPLRQLGIEMDRYLNGYAAVRGYQENRREIERQIGELAAAPNGVAQSMVVQSRRALDTADTKFRNGDLDLVEHLRGMDPNFREAYRVIDKEKERIEASQKFQRMVRQVVLTVAGGFSALLAGILWIFHRKKKPAMDRALENLKEREGMVSKETDGLDQLFTQSSDLLGSLDRIKERGYNGKTKVLSEGTLADIDDLFIMSKEVRRVIAEAKELIDPPGVWEQILNTFSASRYDESVRQLSGKPLKFSKSTGMPTIAMQILRDRAVENGEAPPTEIPDEVVMTFDEIFEAIQGKRQRALDNLKLIEDSLTRVNDELDRCQSDLQKMVNQEKVLSEQSTDTFFPVPKYFDVLIPSIQKDIAEADQLSTSDAVAAMQGPVQSATRKLAEGIQLGTLLVESRGKLFTELKKVSDTLRSYGYETGWIDADLHELTAQADALFELATSRSIAPDIEVFQQSLDGVLEKGKKAVELAELLKSQTAPRLDALPSQIASSRKELAGQLRLPESQVLAESRFNPDDAALLAKKNIEAAVTLLTQGKVEACRAAIAGCEAEVDRAEAWMNASKRTVKEFDDTLRKELTRLEGMVERSNRIARSVADAERSYTSAALKLAYSSSEKPPKSWANPGAERLQPLVDSVTGGDASAENNLVATNQEGAERAGNELQGLGQADPNWVASSQKDLAADLGVSLANQLLERAKGILQKVSKMQQDGRNEYQRGAVLGAISMVRQASELISQTDQRLSRVEEHLHHLEKCVVENEQIFSQCAESANRLLGYEQDRLVMLPTLRQIHELVQHVSQVQQQVAQNNQRTNPFELSELLMYFQKRIAELEGMVVSDHHGHAEAARAVDGAVRQWGVARQYVQQSRTDNIPDSPATKEGIRRVDVLERGVLSVQQEIEGIHGDWHAVGRKAAEVQSDLATVSQQLSSELSQANEALQSFQLASESVYNAEHWTGPWGLRIKDSPGVRQLESARSQLQAGNYPAVLDLSRQAHQMALVAVQRMEREVQKRRIEEQQRAERIRRERMAAEAARRGTIVIGGGGSIFGSGSSGPFGGGGSFGGGGPFGGGGSFGGGGGGGGGVSDNNSGFGRSGW
jgi:hypothetical protein